MRKIMTKIPDGVWPTMLTPYDDKDKIDQGSLKAMIDWYIAGGADGLFTVCQSSEMFYLSLEERLSLAESVVKYAGGRLPVIASAIETTSLEAHVDEIKKLAETGIDACVLISNQYGEPNEDDARFKRTVERILNEVPDLPFGIYECPYPYKRLVSPELLRWCADTGRFLFLKDTCCDIDQINMKIEAVKDTSLKVFNANSATLLASLKLGAAGFSGVMANFHPELYAWLIAHWQTEPEKALKLQNFLGMASLAESQQYPVNAKYYLQMEGLHLTALSRSRKDAALNCADKLLLKQLQNMTKLMKENILTKSGVNEL